MEHTLNVLVKVISMMVFMLPGLVGRKINLVTEKDLKALTNVLLYLCTPFMVLSPFFKLERNFVMLVEMGLFFLLFTVLQLLFLLLMWSSVGREKEDFEGRIACVSAGFGNVGYIGMPIALAMFPDEPIVPCFVSVAMISMNMICFTIGEYFVSGDRKFVSVRAALVNPASIGFYVALPLYLLGINTKLPACLADSITAIGNVCGPLSMIILGIRLASGKFSEIFSNGKAYLASAMKLIAFPLFSWGLLLVFPITPVLRASLVIMSAVPAASATLGIAEIHENGTRVAANSLLLSTLLCVFTIPLITLLL